NAGTFRRNCEVGTTNQIHPNKNIEGRAEFCLSDVNAWEKDLIQKTEIDEVDFTIGYRESGPNPGHARLERAGIDRQLVAKSRLPRRLCPTMHRTCEKRGACPGLRRPS